MSIQQLVATKHIYKICIGNINLKKKLQETGSQLQIINSCIYVCKIDLYFNNLLNLRRLGYDKLDSSLYGSQNRAAA